MGAAKSANYLRKRGVTHVLNSAEGTRIGTVNASQEFYDPFGIKYKGLKLLDTPQSNISVQVSEFIDEALQECVQPMSIYRGWQLSGPKI